MKKYASIDIGSNTIRLIICDFPSGILHTEKKLLTITRLGKDFHNTKRLSKGSIKKSVDALIDYSEIIKQKEIKEVSVKATGVLRMADNTKKFVSEVLKKTGLDIKVISGEEEAILTALGVKSAVRADDSLIFDVGGGSSEFIFSKGGTVQKAASVDIGAVTVYEKYCDHDPPNTDELKSMNGHVNDAILKSDLKHFDKEDLGNIPLIFTAGTATTLAAIKLNMESYDPDKINGVKLTKKELQAMCDGFISITHNERSKIKGLETGREDIIISGTVIALNVMEAFNKKEMTVSDAGLLEGIVIDLYKNQRQSP